jgi:hypothetical protein
VDILNVAVDPAESALEIATRWPDESISRRIVLQPASREDGWDGFVARSEDRHGLRFGIGLSWSSRERGRARISEWNNEDRLDIEVATLASGGVLEHYDWNGRTRLFERGPEPGHSQDMAKRSAWREFYPGSSLDHNLEGERLVQLVLDESFVRWLDRHLESPRRSRTGLRRIDVVESADGIGDWLNVCAALKCSFGGGIANPVCHACFGASLAIAVGNLLCETVADCE